MRIAFRNLSYWLCVCVWTDEKDLEWDVVVYLCIIIISRSLFIVLLIVYDSVEPIVSYYAL